MSHIYRIARTKCVFVRNLGLEQIGLAQIRTSFVTYVTRHKWVTYTYIYIYIYVTWVKSQVRMSYVAPAKELRHTYAWVISHTRMSHVIDMNEWCHAYERLGHYLSTRWQTCVIRKCLRSVIPTCRKWQICVTWCMSDIRHLGMTDVCVTWYRCVCDMTQMCVWHDTDVCVIWYMSDFPVLDVRHASCHTYVGHWGMSHVSVGCRIYAYTHGCMSDMHHVTHMWDTEECHM